MERSLLPDIEFNGGFPEPPAGLAVRVIAARHAACGAATRVRLPQALPSRAVRRVRCAGCSQAFEAEHVAEIRASRLPTLPALPALRMPALPSLSLPSAPSLPRLDPDSRGWKLGSVAVAGVAVIGGLLLIQGEDEPAPVPLAPTALESPASSATPPPFNDGSKNGGKAKANSELVSASSFELALPSGWRRIDPSGGATFAAVAADGSADATLWVEEDPKLDFPTFVSQSLRQLEGLAGSARIVERVPAPTADATVVRLAADAPPGQPSYEVTLRAAGDYRYYLATSVAADAPRESVEGVELIAGSFAPKAKG